MASCSPGGWETLPSALTTYPLFCFFGLPSWLPFFGTDAQNNRLRSRVCVPPCVSQWVPRLIFASQTQKVLFDFLVHTCHPCQVAKRHRSMRWHALARSFPIVGPPEIQLFARTLRGWWPKTRATDRTKALYKCAARSLHVANKNPSNT